MKKAKKVETKKKHGKSAAKARHADAAPVAGRPASPRWQAWGRFLDAVEAAEQELRFDPDEERFYRGHADHQWPLLPTLYRDYTQDAARAGAEGAFFWEFQARARELHHLALSDWDVLFFMRHHEVPTRLLDWTETLAVALYFALEDRILGKPTPPGRGTPCIWILNPYLLNGRGGQKEDLYAPRMLGWDEKEKTYFDYGELLLEPGPWDWKSPLAIYPQQKPLRMGAQRGWFTIHGSDDRPLEQQRPKCVRQVGVPDDAAEAAIEILRIAGIDPYGIYADLDGLAKSLRLKNPKSRTRPAKRRHVPG